MREARATLSTPDGVELDARKAEAIPNEEGWYRLDETIFERPTLESELDHVVNAGDAGRSLHGDAVPDFLVKLDENKSRVGGVQKNKPREEQPVFHRPPANALRVDGDDDRLVLDQSLVYKDFFVEVARGAPR